MEQAFEILINILVSLTATVTALIIGLNAGLLHMGMPYKGVTQRS